MAVRPLPAIRKGLPIRRFLLTLTLASLLTCDSPTVAPPDLPGPAMDGETQASADQSVTITLDPPSAFLIKTEDQTLRPTVMVDGELVDTATVDWFVSDTTVIRDLWGGGWYFRAVDDGFAVILASWGGATTAAAIVVDTPADSVSVTSAYSLHYQSTRRNYASSVEGDSVLLRVFAVADRENDLELRAVAIIGEDTLPMDSPSHVYWRGDTTTAGDEGYFNVFIPPHLVKPQSSLSDRMYVSVDLDTEDRVLDWRSGTTQVYDFFVSDPDTFRLAIVPVLLGSNPDSTILEWTAGITSDSPRIIDIQDRLPVRAGYPVSVLEPHTTEQDLATVGGWSALMSEIDAIRVADGQRAYYYGAFVLPPGSPYGGLAWVGYPVSIGAFFSYYVAHEIGHNMGLLHAPCGGPSFIDPDYPYESGLIGVDGYSFSTKTLMDRDIYYDLMSYCGPSWISGYHFAKALTYRMERETLWWSPAAADMERPPIIADPLTSMRPPVTIHPRR